VFVAIYSFVHNLSKGVNKEILVGHQNYFEICGLLVKLFFKNENYEFLFCLYFFMNK
jgi:hypothetical protein